MLCSREPSSLAGMISPLAGRISCMLEELFADRFGIDFSYTQTAETLAFLWRKVAPISFSHTERTDILKSIVAATQTCSRKPARRYTLSKTFSARGNNA